MNLDDTPLFKCHFCPRGSHNCTCVTEFKAALPSTFMERFVWLCVECLQHGDADNSSLDEKIVGEKVPNAKNESNCNHTQDTSIFHSIYGQSGPDRAMTHLRDAAKTRHPEGPRR